MRVKVAGANCLVRSGALAYVLVIVGSDLLGYRRQRDNCAPAQSLQPMDGEMRDFIHRLNIERFQELLVLEADPHRRRTLEELLAEQEKRFAEEVAKDSLDPKPGLPTKKRMRAS